MLEWNLLTFFLFTLLIFLILICLLRYSTEHSDTNILFMRWPVKRFRFGNSRFRACHVTHVKLIFFCIPETIAAPYVRVHFTKYLAVKQVNHRDSSLGVVICRNIRFNVNLSYDDKDDMTISHGMVDHLFIFPPLFFSQNEFLVTMWIFRCCTCWSWSTFFWTLPVDKSTQKPNQRATLSKSRRVPLSCVSVLSQFQISLKNNKFFFFFAWTFSK